MSGTKRQRQCRDQGRPDFRPARPARLSRNVCPCLRASRPKNCRSMNSPDCPDFIKLEIRSIPPLSWTLEFKCAEDGTYEVLAFHRGLGMSTSEVHRGRASNEHVTALKSVLQAIQMCPQSGRQRVIADGNQIEARMPGGHFKFFTEEEGDNGEAFQHCLQLACGAVLDATTYQRWKLDSV
jgi:hypothetical protein